MKQMKRLLPVLALILLLLAVLALPSLGADPIAYAVYSDTNGSLTFCVGTKTSAGIRRANGAVVTGDEYFTDFENTVQIPWTEKEKSIITVNFLDAIAPVTTAYWFDNCSNLTSIQNLNKLDTSNVTRMESMFYNCSSLTELDLGAFNTANVTNMSYMSDNCSSLEELDLRSFVTSKVTNMNHMFYECRGLTELNVSRFNTSNVTQMYGMFQACCSLTKLDIRNFDTANVTDMSYMFYACTNLETLDIGGFDTSKATNMFNMFAHCYKVQALDVSSFDTSSVIKMNDMFYCCSNLTSLDVSHFNTSNVTRMESMFSNCSGLTSLDVSHFNTSNVTCMESMFSNCSDLATLDVSHFNTSNVTRMESMFSNCSSLTELDVSGFDTSNITDMSGLFYDCSQLTNLVVRKLNTSNVTNMRMMFSNCSNLKNLDVSGFDTSNVTNMSLMFSDCSQLNSLDVSGFKTSKVENMDYMFYGCSGLTELDVSGFNTTNTTSMVYMFQNCPDLSRLKLGRLFQFIGTSALSPLSNKAPYTGKWIREGGNGTTYTSNELMSVYNGATMAGTYVWEKAAEHTHTLIKTEAKAATCLEGGNRAYWTCSGCSKSFDDAQGENEITENSWLVNPLGHAWSGWTKLDNQSHQRVCGNDSSHKETQPHNWSAWETTTEATNEAPGVRTRKCPVCTASEQETIDKKQLRDDETDISVIFPEWVEGDPTVHLVVHDHAEAGPLPVSGDVQVHPVEIKIVNDSGEEVQPQQAVEVHLPLPDGYKPENIVIYHRHSTDFSNVERITDFRIEIVNSKKYIVFITDSFSTFIIVDTSSKTPQPDPNRCPWCGKVHEGFFQKIIGWFHGIFAKLFGAKY